MCKQYTIHIKCERCGERSKPEGTGTVICFNPVCNGQVKVQLRPQATETNGFCLSCRARPGYEGFEPEWAGGPPIASGPRPLNRNRTSPRRGVRREIPIGIAEAGPSRLQRITVHEATDGNDDGNASFNARHHANERHLAHQEAQIRHLDERRTEMEEQFNEAWVGNDAISKRQEREIAEKDGQIARRKREVEELEARLSAMDAKQREHQAEEAAGEARLRGVLLQQAESTEACRRMERELAELKNVRDAETRHARRSPAHGHSNVFIRDDHHRRPQSRERRRPSPARGGNHTFSDRRSRDEPSYRGEAVQGRARSPHHGRYPETDRARQDRSVDITIDSYNEHR